MPNIGDIKSAKELGYKDTHKWIYQSCSVCGTERWVQMVKGLPAYDKCITCSNNNKSRRDSIRNTWLGRSHTDVSKRKISESHIGMKHSETARNAISRSLFGNKRNWQGGITVIEQAVRTMKKYNEWRRCVF